MIYANRDDRVVRVVGTKEECMKDLFNVLEVLIANGITPYEIFDEISKACVAVGWAGDEDDPGE